MPLDIAIRTSRSRHAGYEIYRTVDDTVLTTVATYGEASRYLDTVAPPTPAVEPASPYANWIERDRALGTPLPYAVMTSPGAAQPGNGTLCYAPILRIGDDGVLLARLGRLDDAAWAADREEQFYNPWQRVREVARLHARGLVVLDAEGDVLIMTEDEYASQV